MRILITGITGFVGGHFVETLVAGGTHALAGVSRHADWPVPLAHLAGTAELHPGELSDVPRVEAVLREFRPDWVFHLAGYANTGGSFREPDRCWADNLSATRSLYDAIARSDVRPRILYVSTGLVYGEPDVADQPCDEHTTLKPASPYAASKAAGDILSYQYTRHPGLDIVRVRLFNQIGPRQSADYAVANFARQIAAIEAGRQPAVIEPEGNLSAQRDITDVRDMVTAFPLLLEKGVRGEVYNAGSGKTLVIRDLLDRLIGMSKVRIEVREKVEPGRKADTAVTRADTRKLRHATGWTPRIPLDQTLADILADWRKAASG
ncbi:MAG TPA: GDP-mannose 4,6-dehydratase [Gemmataceae bacterium]|nr:GDP-mannose 4,6-dehydratase [Gemmataceae bacterium]